MEPPMLHYFKFELNLQRMAMISMAISLWEQSHIRNKIQEFVTFEYKEGENKSNEKKWHDITKLILKQIESNTLRSIILKIELTHIIKCMGVKIFNWYEYIRKNIEDDKKESAINYIEKIYWTHYGSIDEVKILKSFWIDNPRLNIVTVYDMACEYALEENINDLWEQIPREIQNKYYANIHVNYKCLIVDYWQCFRNGNSPLFIEYLGRAIRSGNTYIYNYLYNKYHSVEENMFRFSVYEGYSKAVKYFWDKLNEEERNRNVVSGIQISVTSYISDYTIEYYCYRRENFVEIFIFLINQVRVVHKRKTITHIIYDSFDGDIYVSSILKMILLTWPWQDFIVQLLDELEAALKAQNDSYTGLNLLFLIIFCMRRDYNLGYVVENSKYEMILREVWHKIPACLKSKIDEADPHLELIQGLLEIWHLPSIKLIINSPEMTKWKTKLLEYGYMICERIATPIKIGQYELLNQFIEGILVSEKDKKRFKQSIVGVWDYFINEDRYDLADKLLDWQSDSIEEKEELKSKIDHVGLCINFIRNDQYELADKLLDWKFSTRNARQVCKDSFKNNRFSYNYIYKLWAVKKEDVEIARNKSHKFLNWFLHSEEEIVWFKKQKLVNDRLEEILRNLFIEDNYFETIEYFLDWCLLSKKEIQKIKQVIVNKEILKKCICTITWNYVHIAEIFITWAFDEEAERTKFIRQFVLSDEGIECCARFIAGASTSETDTHVSTSEEIITKFNNFIDFWIKPLNNRNEMKGKLGNYLLQYGANGNVEKYRIFMRLLDRSN